jgi:hypothetical protein
MVNNTNSWFRRGGFYPAGVLNGQLCFDNYTGEAHNDYSFRVVIVK